MKTFHSVVSSCSSVKLIFEVELERQRSVFMSIDKTNFENDERCVVVVDSEKFLSLWRSEPNSIHSDVSMGDPGVWMKDGKYHHAASGFSVGIANPVPLATVVFGETLLSNVIYGRRFGFIKYKIRIEREVVRYVSYINGITRTIWLLCNGAKSFPVHCNYNDGAEKLAEYAGEGIGALKTVEQLTKKS